MIRAVALIVAAAVAAAAVPAARAQPGAGDDGHDDGDAPDLEAPPPPAQARVGVFVIGQDGEPVATSVRATLQLSLERALAGDARLEIVDQDVELARRGGDLPADQVSEARGLVGAGEVLLRRGQGAAALARLEAGYAQLREVLTWTPKAELAHAQFLLGAARAVTGDDKGGLAAMVELLAWRPDHVADPTIEPRIVMPLWERAQKRAARLPGGSIEIASSPSGAMAYVDGRFVGFTPTVVEALPAAPHYVTVRMHGRVRKVTAVEVSSKKQATVRVSLAPTPGADRVAAALAEVATAVGRSPAPARVQAALGELSELLAIDHAVVLIAPDDGMGTYAAVVHAVVGGEVLARAQVRLGERDPEEAFAALARALYAQISFEPPEPPPPPRPPRVARPRPFYKTWWFWTAVGATVAAGVAVPLLVGGREPELGCPRGDGCGVVILRF